VSAVIIIFIFTVLYM